jgi:hypothetical protein
MACRVRKLSPGTKFRKFKVSNVTMKEVLPTFKTFASRMVGAVEAYRVSISVEMGLTVFKSTSP